MRPPMAPSSVACRLTQSLISAPVFRAQNVKPASAKAGAKVAAKAAAKGKKQQGGDDEDEDDEDVKGSGIPDVFAGTNNTRDILVYACMEMHRHTNGNMLLRAPSIALGRRE